MNVWTSLVAFGLGLILGYLRDRTDGLLAPFGFHGAFNAVGPTLILLSGGVIRLGGV